MKYFSPRPYQNLMVEHILSNPRSAIHADMGMGKTSGCLYALRTLELIEKINKVLVLAPLRVARSVWPGETRDWSNLNFEVSPIIGDPAARRRALNADAQIYTINYENIPWLVEQCGDRWPFDMIIADESTRLKSFRCGGKKGKRAKALKAAAWRSPRFVELTGTPSPNGLQDLWGQYWFLDKGERLGRSFTAFTNRWFRAVNMYGGPFSRIEPMPTAQEEIMQRITGLTLSLRAKDWFPNLTAPIVNNVEVELSEQAYAQYKDMERYLFTQIETREIETFNAAGKTMKCLQMASGAVYYDDTGAWVRSHDEKLMALESIIEEWNGSNILVAYQFKSDLERLKAKFKQGIVMDSSEQTLKKWNNGQIPLMFIHPASAGHGLNMQHGGHILVFFSHWWDLEQRQQIIERIGPTRQLQAGYSRHVYIYNIVAKGTVDSVVLKRHETKADVQNLLREYMSVKH